MFLDEVLYILYNYSSLYYIKKLYAAISCKKIYSHLGHTYPLAERDDNHDVTGKWSMVLLHAGIPNKCTFTRTIP